MQSNSVNGQLDIANVIVITDERQITVPQLTTNVVEVNNPGPRGAQGPMGVSGLFAQTASSTPITGTIAETSLITLGTGSLTVPANGFKIGDSFHAKLIGHISCANNDTITLKIKTGTVILANTGAITLSTATSKHWELNVYFTIRTLGAATVASIASGGVFAYTKNANTSFEGTNFSVINNTTFDTTVSNTLDITAQWGSTNASNNIYSEIFILNKTF